MKGIWLKSPEPWLLLKHLWVGFSWLGFLRVPLRPVLMCTKLRWYGSFRMSYLSMWGYLLIVVQSNTLNHGKTMDSWKMTLVSEGLSVNIQALWKESRCLEGGDILMWSHHSVFLRLQICFFGNMKALEGHIICSCDQHPISRMYILRGSEVQTWYTV